MFLWGLLIGCDPRATAPTETTETAETAESAVDSEPPDTSVDSGDSEIPTGDCTGEFTSPLIDPASLKLVTPIGILGGGGTEIIGRSYLFPKDDLVGEWLPLYAPTDLHLIGGTHYLPGGAPENYVPDWSLAFAADCDPDVWIELYHVKEVSDALHDVLDETISDSSAWQSAAPIAIEAGELLGYYQRESGSIAFDFIVHDNSVLHPFPIPERYANSNIRDVVCPYSFFEPTVQESYLGLLGAPGGEPIPDLGCGSVVVDVPGTLAGQWFLNPDPSAGIGPLSLENGYGNPLPIVMLPDNSLAIGNMGPTTQGFRQTVGVDGWVDPATVTSEHCYPLDDGYLYFQLEGGELHVAYRDSGDCPDTFPETDTRTYYR